MQVILFGQPNSGKSALLTKLTGARVIASNYPGTTCEISSGKMYLPNGQKKSRSQRNRSNQITVIDTPGVYTLPPLTQDEKVASNLLKEEPQVVVNVVDGTSLNRHLMLTLALLEKLRGKKTRVIIALNQVDRMEEEGIRLDTVELSRILGVPVICTSALRGQGIDELSLSIQDAVRDLRENGHPFASPLNLFHENKEAKSQDSKDYWAIMAKTIFQKVSGISFSPGSTWHRVLSAIDRAMTKSFFLTVSFSVVMFFLLWAIVSFLPVTERVFREILYPLRNFLENLVEVTIPQGPFRSVLEESIPEGFILPLATVFPTMVFGYFSLAVLEDSGLMARYAALSHSPLSLFGLPGQAFFPLMLGFGCRVPGIIAGRTLPTEKARKKTCLVVANLVPCAATLSLAWPCMVKFHVNPLFPMGSIFLSLVIISVIERFLLHMPKEALVLELPPIRVPCLRNILIKTSMRLQGFFTHVLPLVVLVNVAIRVALDANVFGFWQNVASFSQKLFGLSPQAFLAVLLTSAQRYLAPLFLLNLNMTPKEATSAITMVMLGFPCIPSVAAMFRELGPAFSALSILLGAFLLTFWGVAMNYGLQLIYH